MKRWNSLARLLGPAVAAASIGLGGHAMAQPQKTIVNSVADPGDLSGIWAGARFGHNDAINGANPPLGPVDGGPPPLQPWAVALMKQRDQDAKNGHPFAYTKSLCQPAGVPMSMRPPANLPIQILETPGQITILFEEFTNYRIIRMNQQHAADPDPSFFGDSVGHWEGDTLVVDTIGLSERTTIGNIPHSDQLHVVERYRRTGKSSMDVLMTLDDPKAFTHPWTIKSSFISVPGLKLKEYVCVNDRNTPDATGRTGIQLSGNH